MLIDLYFYEHRTILISSFHVIYRRKPLSSSSNSLDMALSLLPVIVANSAFFFVAMLMSGSFHIEQAVIVMLFIPGNMVPAMLVVLSGLMSSGRNGATRGRRDRTPYSNAAAAGAISLSVGT